MSDLRARVVVVGSGAGGATTALTLAEAGLDVLLLEEGHRWDDSAYGAPMSQAMPRLYRRAGMTPIVGPVALGYVEGACLGGSTEINSGFWHRAPREALARWRARYGLEDAQEEDLAPHYAWAEQKLGVGPYPGEWPASTRLFARGIERMGWSYAEVPRAAPGCRGTNRCAQGCPTGAKQGMSRALIPDAERLGVRVVTGFRALQVLIDGRRARGVLGVVNRDGTPELVRVEADHVFVCAGPTESPALLLRSGVRFHVGNSLRVHPYLKVAALFDEEVDALHGPLPLLQVKEFAPELSLGGAFFSPGQLAMTVSENWPTQRQLVREHRRVGTYYVGVRGTGQGWVRPSVLGEGATDIRYDVARDDVRHLGIGLARLSQILLAAGARSVTPSVWGAPPITNEAEAVRYLDEPPRGDALALVTVHAFSSCPAGEVRDLTAVTSFGAVHDVAELFVSDASTLPDSPGVNPQGTVMALARRNALAFADRVASEARRGRV